MLNCKEVILQPGKYILGDHNKLVKREHWGRLHQNLSNFGSFSLSDTRMSISGVSYFFTSAMYWANRYEDSKFKYSFETKSGYVGLFPFNAPFLNSLTIEEIEKHSVILEFNHSFSCFLIENGVFKISDIVFDIGSQINNETGEKIMNKLKAGTYFIGDPCYIVKDKCWSDFVNGISDESNGIFSFSGVDVFVSRTLYGDGTYSDEQGKYQFPVDAGIIGAIPFSNMDFIESMPEEEVYRLGTVVTFSTDFAVQVCDEEGKIVIGSIVINTGDDEIEEEEFEDDSDEDEKDNPFSW